ncbi:TetR/AcrR family transcriptional regulator [Streptomyces sp. NPDC050560]|uniref:TetR/AcrR family transcriptional regulator n=1 Tax=Streptomyces sp. NPDC050560 TaxID=3365630 RepID=UPI00378F0C9E
MVSATGRRGLNRELIVAAARRIADAEGIGELTLRRVAAELGTGQASLYRHIADRAELLGLLVEDLAAGFPLVDAAGEGPRAAAVRQWEALYAHLAEHRWGARIIADGYHLARGGHRVAGHAVAQLARCGLDSEAAERAYRALWRLLLGHLVSDHPFGQHGPGREDAVADPAAVAAGDFSWALRRLLDGVAAGR